VVLRLGQSQQEQTCLRPVRRSGARFPSTSNTVPQLTTTPLDAPDFPYSSSSSFCRLILSPRFSSLNACAYWNGGTVGMTRQSERQDPSSLLMLLGTATRKRHDLSVCRYNCSSRINMKRSSLPINVISKYKGGELEIQKIQTRVHFPKGT
jgi:hypothetical protein